MGRRHLWLLTGIWFCGAIRAQAGLPEVEARVDTAAVTVGDPFQLTLRLRYRPDERPALPPVSAWLRGFAPRPGEQRGPASVDGEVEVVQRYELRLYEPGGRQIPPLAVDFIQSSGDTLVRTTDPIDIEVVSARTEEDESLRDIKPPVAVPGGVPLWLAAVLALAAAALVGAAVYWFLRRRQKPEIPPPPPEPLDHAAEFIRIADMGLVERGDFKTYYSLLSETLRRFLEQRLDVEAMEQTTTEICAALVEISLDAEIARDIEAFLGFADLVKFARLLPEIERARRAPEAGIAVIRAVDRFKKERETPPEPEPAPVADVS